MKLQTIALALALAATGSAFAATRDVTVTRETPHGVVTKHIIRTNDRDHWDRYHHRHVARKVIIRHPAVRYNRKVVIVHPAHHGHYAVNRTVVVHRPG